MTQCEVAEYYSVGLVSCFFLGLNFDFYLASILQCFHFLITNLLLKVYFLGSRWQFQKHISAFFKKCVLKWFYINMFKPICIFILAFDLFLDQLVETT